MSVSAKSSPKNLDSYEAFTSGWDIICANRKDFINQKLKKLYDDEILPHRFEGVSISCPELLGGDIHKQDEVRIKLAIEGEISMKKIDLIEVYAECELTINLDDLGVSIKHYGDTAYTITINFDDDKEEDIFRHLDLFDVKVSFLGHEIPVEEDEIEEMILKVLNRIFRVVPSLSFDFKAAIPVLSLKNAKLELAFVENPEPSQSFLAILIGLDGKKGVYELSPDTIDDAQASTAFVVANQVLMTTCQKMLNLVAEEYDFQVSTANPAMITNQNSYVLLDNDWGIRAKIEKDNIWVTFSKDLLNLNINVEYQLTDLCDWQTLELKFEAKVDTSHGELLITVAYAEEPPAWLWVVLFPVAFVQNLAHDGKTFTFKVPDFEVTKINISNYLQLSGNWNQEEGK